MAIDVGMMEQLGNVVEGTNFDFFPEKYVGKVRDCYTFGDKRFLITTDRLSCFDRVVTSIPFKGQVLNQLAVYWFKQTEVIIANQLISVPDPNVMLVRNCEIVPVEVIVRGYLAGSAWRDYQAGRDISGIRLPGGLRQNQKLPEVIITPSTKAVIGEHDQPISEQQIIEQGLVEERLWNQIRTISLKLFKLGSEHVKRHGLILVDTKYEFGLYNGELILADELHTLDSSRYWIAESYQELFEKEEMQVMLDKEPTRQWLLQKGFKGDGEVPPFTAEHRIDIARHYVTAFEKITGQKFEVVSGPALDRIEKAVRECLKQHSLAAGRP